MITAIDTNVLIDVLAADPRYVDRSLAALRTCAAAGQLVVCEIVLAEIARYFDSLESLQQTFDQLNIAREALGEVACFSAGQVFRAYRKQGGTRDRVLADFLIAAHAQTHCTRLLTRDRGFYRTYFPNLAILDPSA